MSAHDVDATSSQSSSAVQTSGARPFWPEGWWRLTDFRIGIIPLPIYFLLVVLIAALVAVGEVKSDGPTMIVVLVLGGFTCAEIGKRIPVLRNIGAGAIFATFIPSALAYYHLIPSQIETSIVDFTKLTNFLYLFIASIIVGSIFAMDRDVLIRGFLKIFVPLVVGSIVAALVGTIVGTLLGLGAHRTFFMSWYRLWQAELARAPLPISSPSSRPSSPSWRPVLSLAAL
jgi:Na+/citrate or Na+/malate symporter